MKAWEKHYEPEDLDEAIELAGNIKITGNDGVRITAQVENYNVETFIEYSSPSYSSCTCPSQYPCKHEAALTYYLKNHPELYLDAPDFDEIFSLVSPDYLRDFLLNELKTDSNLKDKFLKRFSHNPIDRNYYTDKLYNIFERGKQKDFDLHGTYDLDLMAGELYEFLFTDISNVLSTRDHDFACDLLISIAVLLNDEIVSTYDSWYDLVDRFMEDVSALSFSVYLDAVKLDALYANMDHIMSVL